jgi:hypothetical protein
VWQLKPSVVAINGETQPRYVVPPSGISQHSSPAPAEVQSADDVQSGTVSVAVQLSAMFDGQAEAGSQALLTC